MQHYDKCISSGAEKMKVTSFYLYKINGLNSIQGGDEIEIFKCPNSGGRAFLTCDVKKYDIHLRRLAVINRTLLSSIIPTDENSTIKGNTHQERYNNLFKQINIERQDKNVYLVLEFNDEMNELPLDSIIEFEEFIVSLNGEWKVISKIDQERVRNLRDAAFGGIFLTFSKQTTDTFNMCGNAVFAISNDNGKLIYGTNLTITSTGHIFSVGLTDSSTHDARIFSKALFADVELRALTRLLTESAYNSKDNLMSFLFAWTAMEVFIQKVFKTSYEKEFFLRFKSISPVTSKEFLDRIRTVMTDKYNVYHKFVAISSILDEQDAEKDIEEFKEIQDKRNKLAHKMHGASEELPSENIRRLLKKYLLLHILHKQK